MNTEKKPPSVDIVFEKKDPIVKQNINPNKNNENNKTIGKISENEKETVKKIQTKKNRCFSCNKKVGYTGMKCRCEYIFCGNCRYPEQHSCTFDFKTYGKKILEKQNEKIVNNQLETI